MARVGQCAYQKIVDSVNNDYEEFRISFGSSRREKEFKINRSTGSVDKARVVTTATATGCLDTITDSVNKARAIATCIYLPDFERALLIARAGRQNAPTFQLSSWNA